MTTARARQRADPRWWTPEPLPAALAEFEPLPGEGHPRTTVGLLDLEVAPVAGATRVVRQFHRTPLYLLRPIYLDERRPGMAFLYLQHHSDGFVQGDRCRIDLTAAAGSQVHLTSQAATKIYGMEVGYATQLVNLTAVGDAFVEYLPDPVIPFRRSRFYSATTVTVDPRATVMLAETLLPGRLASGECHAYDLYLATTRIRRPAGELVALDVLDFGASYGRADTPARLGPYPVHAAFFVLAPAERLAGLADLLVQTLSDRTEVLVGVTGLPYDAGLIARVLGPSSIPVRDVLRSAWDTARRHLTGAPAPDLRKG